MARVALCPTLTPCRNLPRPRRPPSAKNVLTVISTRRLSSIIHRLVRVFALFLGLVALRPLAAASSDPAAACAAAKLVATGAATQHLLGCQGKATASGGTVAQKCIDSANQKLTVVFGVADAAGGCIATGDAGTIDSQLQKFLSGVVTALRPNRAQAAKLPAPHRTTTTAWLDLGVTGVPDITIGAVDIAPAARSRSHRQDVVLAVSGPVVSAGTDLALPASGRTRHEQSGHCRCRHARAAHRLPRHELRSRSRSCRDGTPRRRRSGSDRPAGGPGCAPPGCPGSPPCGSSGWRAAPTTCRPEVACSGAWISQLACTLTVTGKSAATPGERAAAKRLSPAGRPHFCGFGAKGRRRGEATFPVAARARELPGLATDGDRVSRAQGRPRVASVPEGRGRSFPSAVRALAARDSRPLVFRADHPAMFPATLRGCSSRCHRSLAEDVIDAAGLS